MKNWYAIKRVNLRPGEEDMTVQVVRCQPDEAETCVAHWDSLTGESHYFSGPLEVE